MNLFRKISFLILCQAILLQVGCGKSSNPQQSCGFVQNSEDQRVSWKTRQPIKIFIDNSVPTQYYETIQAAMDTWNKNIGYKIFDLQTTPLPTGVAVQDGKNVIYWLPAWDSPNKNQQANTTIFWVENRITEADIKINAESFSYSATPGATDVDLQSLFVHELGHALGLKHQDSVPSVMYKSLANGFIRRDLYPVDAQSIKCEY